MMRNSITIRSFSIQQISIEYLLCTRHYRHWTVSVNNIDTVPALWILSSNMEDSNTQVEWGK